MSPATDEKPDIQLLRRVARGEMTALRELYDQHARYAKRIATQILGDAGDAEDVVQETFVALWDHPARFDPKRGSVRALIVTMARSRAIDRQRARGSARRAADAAHLDLKPDSPPFADQLLDQNQANRQVHVALRSLPRPQREIIELAYFHGLTQTEIARRTGAPLGTVKMRIHLAMKKLSNQLVRIP